MAKEIGVKKPWQRKNKISFFGAKTIEDSLSYLLNPIFTKNKKDFLIINNLSKNWQDVVGEKYAKFCRPKIIKNSNKQNSKNLIVIAYNSAIGFFLENNSGLIIDRISALYGFKVVDKIIIKQEPQQLETEAKTEIKLEKNQEDFLQEILAKCENQELSQTLLKLGKEIFRKTN
jgi:hypothetical protein